MKEEEAKKKWCPFARVGARIYGPDVVAVNRHSEDIVVEKTTCIGSACMAWRIKTPQYIAIEGLISLEEAKKLMLKNNSDPIKEGFCGLAGKP